MDACRRVECIRHYTPWVKYDQRFKRRLSKGYLNDGDFEEIFSKQSGYLGSSNRIVSETPPRKGLSDPADCARPKLLERKYLARL